MSELRLKCRSERLALREPFVISRGTKTHAEVIVVEIRDAAGRIGRGEAVPYARYGESVSGSLAIVESYRGPLNREVLRTTLPPGAARNAIDCALFDLEAKSQAMPAHSIAGLDALRPVETAYTISLGSPEAMSAAAARVPHLNLLKLKLGGRGDEDRLRAVRDARPDARLIADANEAWSDDMLTPLMEAAAEVQVDLIEQPLPAGADSALERITRTVPVCADESAHTTQDLAGLRDRYDAVNIKLDKAGGLTEALHMTSAARSLGLDVMIGSMVASSLAAAPALIVAQQARWVDLDGPLLLAQDRPDALIIRDGWIDPPDPALWG